MPLGWTNDDCPASSDETCRVLLDQVPGLIRYSRLSPYLPYTISERGLGRTKAMVNKQWPGFGRLCCSPRLLQHRLILWSMTLRPSMTNFFRGEMVSNKMVISCYSALDRGSYG